MSCPKVSQAPQAPQAPQPPKRILVAVTEPDLRIGPREGKTPLVQAIERTQAFHHPFLQEHYLPFSKECIRVVFESYRKLHIYVQLKPEHETVLTYQRKKYRIRNVLDLPRNRKSFQEDAQACVLTYQTEIARYDKNLYPILQTQTPHTPHTPNTPHTKAVPIALTFVLQRPKP